MNTLLASAYLIPVTSGPVFTPAEWPLAPIVITAGLVFLFVATSAWIEHVDQHTHAIDGDMSDDWRPHHR
jgi:hypothetical protein